MAQTSELKIGTVEVNVEPSAVRGVSPQFGSPRKSKNGIKILVAVVGLVVLIGLATAGVVWSQRGLVTVQTGKVARGNILAVVTASGQIMPPPDDYATVNANSFGKITQLLVQEGDHVKKGQLLMKTEDVQQAASVEAQQAALVTARADLQGSAAAVSSAGASLKTAEANLAQAQAKYVQAKDDYGRDQALYKAQVISRQTMDQGFSDFQVAKATVQSNEAQIAQQKALLRQAVFNRDMSKARVMQNQAQLESAQNVYEQTIYRSPLTGIITSLPVHLGENVVPGIQNQVGSELFQVSNLKVITAQVNVDESDIVSVQLGQKAQVSIDAIPNKVFSGKVTQIGMMAIDQNTGQPINTSSSASVGTSATDFQVLVTLDHPPQDLRPGLSATAKIITARADNVAMIPIQGLTMREQSALEKPSKNKENIASLDAPPAPAKRLDLFSAGQKDIQGVFVVRNGRAVFVPVKTGVMGTTHVEVLSGLKAGDTIITGSYKILRTLKNNTKVRVDNSVHLGPPSSSS